MASLLDYFRRPVARTSAGPFSEVGFGGTAAWGGAVAVTERNPKLIGSNRWKTAEDILTNASIVAAGMRYFLDLTARPAWRAEAADDKPAAKEAAEFLESVIHGTDTSWSRIIRRSGAYRFPGFGIHEWQAKRRDDGRTGFAKIRRRPAHTIERWDLDEHGEVLGVIQRSPQTSQEVYLPRSKIIYLVDDALSDSPEGMGWYRHLVDPWTRLEKYLKLEAIGFERDLSGIPIGRAPISAIKQMLATQGVEQKDIDAKAQAMLAGIEDIVRIKSKSPDTGVILDSQPFVAQNSDGTKSVSTVPQWDLQLMTGDPGSVEELGEAIGRTIWDMALIMGVERLLVGREGTGSLALSEDTSQNLFLNINSTLGDLAEAYDRDFVGPLWALNGLDPELRPTLKVEDASFKDVAKIARVLADMANAGAILAPDDPAIDDVRDLAGISRQPEMTPERMGMLNPSGGLGGKPDDDPEDIDANPTDPEGKGAD